MQTAPQHTKKVSVFNRAAGRREFVPAYTHLRMRLIYTAIRDGLQVSPGVEFWSSLAPLNKRERAFTHDELARLRAMPPAEQSAELLLMKEDGNL